MNRVELVVSGKVSGVTENPPTEVDGPSSLKLLVLRFPDGPPDPGARTTLFLTQF